MKKILLILLLSSFRLAHATIVTGTVSPGLLSFAGQEAVLYDFDNNGQYDLYLQVIKISGNNYELLVKGVNGAQVETSSSTDNVMGYNQGTLMGVNVNKDSGYVRTLYFPQASQKYIGFKFNIGGSLCCAYLRVSSTDYTQGIFSFDSYGYETSSTNCIGAGAINTGVTSYTPLTNDFVVTQRNNLLIIKPASLLIYSAAVYNLIGIKLFETANQYGETNIPLAGIAPSILFVKLSYTENKATKEMVKKVATY